MEKWWCFVWWFILRNNNLFMCLGHVSIFSSNMFSSFANISILCFSRFLNLPLDPAERKMEKLLKQFLKLFTQNVPIDILIKLISIHQTTMKKSWEHFYVLTLLDPTELSLDFYEMSRGAENENTANEIDDLMNFSHGMRWLWVLGEAFATMAHESVEFYCHLKVYRWHFSLKQKNFYDSSCSPFFTMLRNLWRWLIKCAQILVGGRAGKKQPTKVRAKQPKASKKVKFISEYHGAITNRSDGKVSAINSIAVK